MIAIAPLAAAYYLSNAISPEGEPKDIEDTAWAEPTGRPAPLTEAQKKEQLFNQLYVESVDPQDEKKTLNPLFGGVGSATMRGKKNGFTKNIDALFQKHPDGKVPVAELWDAMREGLSSEDLMATDMTDEALLDLFGTEEATLDQALEALTFARHMFAYRPDKYNFQSYRRGKEFVPLPTGFYEQVKSSPNYQAYFKLLDSSPNYRAMVANLKQQGVKSKEAQEQARRIALTLLWNDFLNYCEDEKIDLDGIRGGDAIVAARLGRMVLQYDNGELGETNDKIKAEIELLKKLSEAGLGKLFKNKQDSMASDASLQYRLGIEEINFADDMTFKLFFDEFFGGRRDLSTKDMAEVIKKMFHADVADKLDRIKGKSSEIGTSAL
jgi:hypothetical protein